MSAKDAAYYIGLFGGLIAGTLALRAMGISGIFQLLGGLVVGVGCGYLAERVCSAGTDSGPDDFPPPPGDGDPYIRR